MLATGRFTNNTEAHDTMQELIDLRYTGHQLRFVFVLLLDQDCAPCAFYKRFAVALQKDFLDRGMSPAAAQLSLASALLNLWVQAGHDKSEFPLPDLLRHMAELQDRPALPEAESRRLRLLVEGSAESKRLADEILSQFAVGADVFFFVHGRAGTGKSTLANYLTHAAESTQHAVLNVATTGQAALQLAHGATAHSTFGIPTTDDEYLTSTVTPNTAKARMLAQTKLLQWDEWPMAKRASWDCVVQLLQRLRADLSDVYVPKVVVCYGDFRQIPPVVKYCTRAEIVQHCVRASPTWARFRVRHLHRAHRTAADAKFTEWLETIGNGTCPAPHTWNGHTGYVALSGLPMVDSEQEAVDFAFPTLHDPHRCSKAKIVATTNDKVDHFNALILNRLVMDHGLSDHSHYSADSVEVDANSVLDDSMTTEFLNTQSHLGVPPHRLRLVRGGLYELMRNLNSKERLMNHTPVILKDVHRFHVVIATLDQREYPIPRIIFQWALGRGACAVLRRQLPLRPAYASTFNGAQGATLERCAVDARADPFAHGHLYVALGRVSHRMDLRILSFPDRRTPQGEPLIRNV
eukprot:3504782-Pyramimonas_sp.AAC.1